MPSYFRAGERLAFRAAQVMRALPPARLAGLLSSGPASDGLLAERLDWCRGWTQEVAARDADPQCQMLAAGCQSLQVCP